MTFDQCPKYRNSFKKYCTISRCLDSPNICGIERVNPLLSTSLGGARKSLKYKTIARGKAAPGTNHRRTRQGLFLRNATKSPATTTSAKRRPSFFVQAANPAVRPASEINPGF